MDLELVSKIIVICGVLISALTFVFNQITRYSASNRFMLIEDKSYLVTNFKNTGSPIIQENYRRITAFTFWKQYSTANYTDAVLSCFCKLEHFLSGNSQLDYSSIYAIVEQDSEFPARLEKFEKNVVIFDLDEMVNAFIKTEETLGNRFLFLLTVLFMKVEINFNNGREKFYSIDWKAKWYLIRKYLNNKELYR